MDQVLDRGGSLDLRDEGFDATLLHFLVVGGANGAAVIDLLLAAGADPNARTENGITPLAAALARDDEAIAELLLERGAEPGPPGDHEG